MTDSPADPIEQFEEAGRLMARVRAEVAKRVIGQDRVVELALTTILAGGHGLVMGVPGLAKTRLVGTLATVLGLESNRIQFTPDLMPADILGSEVLEDGPDGSRQFKFIEGPVFCQLLMADEINRASPRTQSALLQAMQEHEVTVAGERRVLSEPYHVLATQNPLEQEGTYPLPEAQLDRFMLRIDIDFPDEQEERAILLATTGTEDAQSEPVLDAAKLIEIQQLVRAMPVGESVVEAILKLVRGARPNTPEAVKEAETLSWGPGPRAAQALMLAVRARALLQGRLAPSVQDVIELAHPALAHRMALTFAARAAGHSIGEVIDSLVAGRLQAEAA